MLGLELPGAGHPGGALVDCHAMSALVAWVEPVHDETESAAFVSGCRLSRLAMATAPLKRTLMHRAGVGAVSGARVPQQIFYWI
jgi:hypothetical protein